MALLFLGYRKLDYEMLSKCQVFPETTYYVNSCFWNANSLLCLKGTANTTMILKCYRTPLQNINVQNKRILVSLLVQRCSSPKLDILTCAIKCKQLQHVLFYKAPVTPGLLVVTCTGLNC